MPEVVFQHVVPLFVEEEGRGFQTSPTNPINRQKTSKEIEHPNQIL